ncbi:MULTISPECIES: DNA polymerase III subunit beta [unclassified Leptolyngbya]|uniref:DNA polymerase III subunit beta n=1 Tax=unclassified Leptolyngbya TaxID=2650499 RepID=UPI001684A0A3|nr:MULTISPECIES: DNA polymerase III subunit beta [unclassified Leptolyngbya]MBD1911469.1 DNA polymerase III subunit beta [Leptolyngbya sp. FACHB-8]MBD2156397.1 DNA polymerase III subunit beta [Leptolyngbya sp. FACHB-16]
MKLTCTQSDLNAHLSLVSRAVPSRPSHPVLANILLIADEETQQVRLTGFDLSLGVQTSFSAEVETGGKLTLPARLLSDIVSRLPDGSLTLEDESGEHTATLTSTSGRYQMRGMGAEDYPELPTIADTEGTSSLPVEALIEGLRGSLFAASSDEAKQVLTGVHLTVDTEGMEFAATDGHRLAVVQTPNVEDAAVSEDDTFDVTVPGKALRELERMLQMNSAGNAIAVRFDQGQLIFEWENQRLTSRLLEGQYPNYRQLIPRQFSRQMTVDRRAFTSSLERIAVLADQKNNIVKFNIDSGAQEVVLSVDAPDVGSGREAMPAQVSGDDLEIAFNVKYLLEGLKAFNTTDIQMQFNTSTSPSIIVPLGGMKMTYLVMPVQVRS